MIHAPTQITQLVSWGSRDLNTGHSGLPRMGSGRESACHARDTRDAGSIPGSGRSPGVGNGNSPVFLPEKFHGQRSLAGYSPFGHSPWGHKELVSRVTKHTLLTLN